MRDVPLAEGQAFHVSDRVLLVHDRETILGTCRAFGVTDGGDQIAYLMTFSGKVNRKDRTGSVTLAMSPTDALELAGELLRGLELLVATEGDRAEQGDDLAQLVDDLRSHGETPATRLPRLEPADAIVLDDEQS